MSDYRYSSDDPEVSGYLTLQSGDWITVLYADGEWLYGEVGSSPLHKHVGKRGWFPSVVVLDG